MDQNFQENYEELKKQRRLMVLNYKKERHLELLNYLVIWIGVKSILLTVRITRRF